jgi:hypothetical protein
MSRNLRHSDANEPAESTNELTESTKEPKESTIEPGDSTNEPERLPTNPAAFNPLHEKGFRPLRPAGGPCPCCRKAEIADRTRQPGSGLRNAPK